MIKLYEFNPIEMLRDMYTLNSEITQTGNNILAIRISSCKIMNILKVKYGSSTLIGGNSSLECNEMAE